MREKWSVINTVWGRVTYHNFHFIITLETVVIFPSCWIESASSCLFLRLSDALFFSCVSIAFTSNCACEVATECKLIMKKMDTGKEEGVTSLANPSLFPITLLPVNRPWLSIAPINIHSDRLLETSLSQSCDLMFTLASLYISRHPMKPSWN